MYGMAVGPGGVLLLAGVSEKAMGIWDDADQESPVVYLDPVESAVATSNEVEGTKTVLTDYLDESPTGVEDTGGGEQDALLLEFYPDDL
jgi:hypothetical protein